MIARTILPRLAGLLLLSLLVLLPFFPQLCAEAFRQGLLLCGCSVLPALFPFFVVSSLFTGCPGAGWLARPLSPLTRLCGFKGKDAPLLLLLSWTGGYAVCAACLGRAVRQGRFSPREAGRFAVLGTCCSPGFAVGAVGALTGRPALGAVLHLVQLAACVLSARALRRAEKPDFSEPCPPKEEASFPDFSAALQQAIASSLTVCGCVLFFGLLTRLAVQLLGAGGLASAALHAFFEISGGTAALCGCGGATALYGVCALFSLYSLSVWLQLRALSGGAFSLAPLLATRPLHLAVSLGLLRLCTRFMPGVAATFNTLAPRLLVHSRLPADAALLLLVLCSFVLNALHRCCFTISGKTDIIKPERTDVHVWQSKKDRKGGPCL